MSKNLIHYFTLPCYRDLVSYLLSYANNSKMMAAFSKYAGRFNISLLQFYLARKKIIEYKVNIKYSLE